MEDRELLELAAKAAGNGAGWHSHDPFHLYPMRLPDGGNWNPLDDDGDALRLLAQLRLEIEQSNDGQRIYAAARNEAAHVVHIGPTLDPAAATRRAIVLAAADLAALTPNTGDGA